MLNQILEDEDVLKILNSPNKPNLQQIIPIIKKYKISSVSQMWDIFDRITKEWINIHDSTNNLDYFC